MEETAKERKLRLQRERREKFPKIVTNKEKLQKRAWYDKNLANVKASNKNRYAEKKEEIILKCKLYVENNRDVVCKRRKSFYDKNRERLLNDKKLTYVKHRDRLNNNRRIKYRLDPKPFLEKNRIARQKIKDFLESLNERERVLYLELRKRQEVAYREANRDKINKAKKKYNDNNPDVVAEKDARRRLRVKASVSQEDRKKTAQLIKSWRKETFHFCTYCDVRLEQRKYHIDHIYPLALGGLHVSDNLCISCPTCNISKGAKVLGVSWFPK